MVIVYKIGRIGWNLFGRWLIQTKFITLPNILAGREIVPELVPNFVGAEPIAEIATELLEDRSKYELQIQELTKITDEIDAKNAAQCAADIIAEHAGLEPVDADGSDREREESDRDAPVARPVGD